MDKRGIDEKVRMGVIGLGGMGQGHINKIGEIAEAEFTAVSDVDFQVTKNISEAVPDAKQGISRYVNFYNQERPHQSLDYKTPAVVYFIVAWNGFLWALVLTNPSTRTIPVAAASYISDREILVRSW